MDHARHICQYDPHRQLRGSNQGKGHTLSEFLRSSSLIPVPSLMSIGGKFDR
jgi:hypothetical protein